MRNIYYDLYCDESGIDRGVFYFGAIHCSNERARILSNSVTAFRAEHEMFSEMKWGSVSKTKLPQYKAFADIFLDDPVASFIFSTAIKGRHWRKLGKSNATIFMNAYFYFLEDTMSPFPTDRYSVFLDGSSIKPYKFDSLRICLNKPSPGKVRVLKKIDSKEHDLIQLVDVVLGAMSSSATASHKRELSNHVKMKFAQNIKTRGMAKLRTLEWIAPENRKFVPNL